MTPAESPSSLTNPRLQELRTALEPSRTELDRLQHRFLATANDRGLVDVAYRTLESPIGQLLVATTPQGLVRVAFEAEGFDEVLRSLGERVSPRIVLAPARLDEVARQLERYFSGARHSFDLALDLVLTGGFRGAVQQSLPQIPYGQTRSYKQLAALVGNPRAIRAVGSACATNPIPLVLPCHRVTRSDGTYGQYRGGAAAKHALLQMESPRG